MNRRIVIRNMALAVSGLVLLPGCDLGSKKAAVQELHPYLSPSQEGLLTQVVDTIIPATDTPGAKDLNVHVFVQKMLIDCNEKETQDNVVTGLKTLKAKAKQQYGKTFGACTTEERIALLSAMEKSEVAAEQDFYRTVKGLTVRGYMTSEYVMMNLTHYEAVPGYYYGCVPVDSKPIS
ncbi:gluconate 2-dehydrogenase subunit 3 family protein [Pontibacter sp. E15-1]|uniref:gluconate 2-dehydrogenase subunit 3 family protein n=1 Tax=Pontibacter sp. E15-1 TaxID=2919918 RepID=UPI001F4FCAF2|nr:gluconate 2-dehydrogenase subunit 3 family protein [Pontibacter sp. E15-1]MCJ8167339.1 gluconate 2-dehydrogenase subunit 3 family protein [Pontibacter sp. E15-1]